MTTTIPNIIESIGDHLWLDHINDVFENLQGNNNCTRINFAAYNGMEAMVRECLSQSADLSLTYPYLRRPALMCAADNGHDNIVELLLCFGAHANECDNYWDTALHGAAMKGNQTLITLLLNNGGNINAFTRSRETALYISIKHGRGKVAKQLIDRGADINQPVSGGITPLMVCVDLERQDIFDFLLAEPDLDLDAADQFSMTALMFAATARRGWYYLQRLLQSGANVNKTNEQGCTALMMAAEKDSVVMVRILLEYGADKSILTEMGDSAISLARSREVKEILMHYPDEDV